MNKMKKLVALAGSTVGLATMATPVAAQISIAPPTGFATDIAGLLNGALSFVMIVAALLVFMYLIWGGIEWVTSGGDKGKTESARNKITAAVLGLIVIAASYAILTLTLNFLGFSGGLDEVINSGTNIRGEQIN